MTADPVPAALDPSHVVVQRWRRFGHDRLYVSSSGTVETRQIGYRDLVTGLDHPERPEDTASLASVADAWVGRNSAAVSATIPPRDHVPDPAPATPPAATEPGPSPAPVRPWLDLTQNRPGAAVQVRASAERAEAPIRTALARILGQHNDERAWRIGAKGESLVGKELADLARKNPLWTSIHAIPVGNRGSDIDHLVIGPGGVFTLNTKHHPDADIWVGGETFMVNGRKVPYVRNARFEAERASRLLTRAVGFPLHVTALVVPVRCKAPITVKSQPRDVFVVTRRDLTRWLLRTGEILPSERLGTIWDMARRSTTWTG